MSIVLNAFARHLQKLTDKKNFVVAYSGGVDSHVLLHLLSQILEIGVTAVYVNHGLHPDANMWQDHCNQVCIDLNIPFKAFSIEIINKPRHSLEALAREQRYAVLSEMVDAKTALLTAHHENDQAETVLLQLMRGAGVKGLSAMPIIKLLGKGEHIRPLLTVSRADIEFYARQHQLYWIEDSSNHQLNFDRNFLRQNILPALILRRKGVLQNMTRTASHMAEATNLLNEFAALDFEKVKTDNINCLNISALKQLSSARQSQVIRYWLTTHPQSIRLPSQAILQQIKQQLILATYCPKATVSWANITLTRDYLYLIMEPNF